MILEVKLFARAKEIAGTGSVEVELPQQARVADVRLALCERCPDLAPLISSLLIAVGTEYATDGETIDTECEIACFPPVSGG
jgi:molybdopterin converting factor subunit 1